MFIKKATWLFTIGLFLLIIFIPGYSKISELRQKNQELEAEIKQLEKNNLTLKQEKENLEKDPFYLEKAAREKLGVVKKGEIIYKVVPQKEQK